MHRRFPRKQFMAATQIKVNKQADLVDISCFAKLYKGYKYLLTYGDVLLKLAWVMGCTDLRSQKKTSRTQQIKSFSLCIFYRSAVSSVHDIKHCQRYWFAKNATTP